MADNPGSEGEDDFTAPATEDVVEAEEGEEVHVEDTEDVIADDYVPLTEQDDDGAQEVAEKGELQEVEEKPDEEEALTEEIEDKEINPGEQEPRQEITVSESADIAPEKEVTEVDITEKLAEADMQDQDEAATAVNAHGAFSLPPSETTHSSQQGSSDQEGSPRPVPEETEPEKSRVPTAPHLPTPERTGTSLEGTMSSCALNVVWSFGLNRNVPVLNLTDGVRKAVMYACSHVGVIYDFENNRQYILQAHLNPITCVCISEDKRWLVTADKGVDSMVNVWDTYTCTPIHTLFDDDIEGGIVALALTPDARYLATLSAGPTQYLKIWDWTLDGKAPICCAKLRPQYGLQHHLYFNPENIRHIVTNSETQIIFYHWDGRLIEYYAPSLTDDDFNRPVGRYCQSVYMSNSSRALTATSIGNLVVWDNNLPLTKVVSTEQSADKKALKIIKVQDRGINVLTTTDKYIVAGDQAGHVKFFDQGLKLVYWYKNINLGPIVSVSFAADPDFQPIARQNSNYPSETTIPGPKFVIRDFTVGTGIAIVGNITADGSKVKVIQREHDAAVNALSAHPFFPLVATGSYSGLLKVWNYETKKTLKSRAFESGSSIHCCAFDSKGAFLVVGYTSGLVRILDAFTLKDELAEPFHYARAAITHIAFPADSLFLATADAQHTITLFKAQPASVGDPFVYLGRYCAHYKPIKELLFGLHLDSNKPRLLSLGADRMLVEYDLEKSTKDNIILASSERLEQSGVPMCMTWYPPLTKERFILTANDQFKFKLYNASTKMCRRTLLGPTYGSPVQKLAIVFRKEKRFSGKSNRHYVAYITDDKVGMVMLPLDGNPHNAMAVIAHPTGATNLAVSIKGRYLFTAGGLDATVHMWEINFDALDAQARLGGEDLIPFYAMLEGGHEGELFSELEDFFYFAQIRSQGINTMLTREVSTTIPLAQVPFVMRAVGFYPSEQEIEDMTNEIKFSRYVETGQYMEQVDLGTFIKLYVNHRPAFGLSPDKLLRTFDTLGVTGRNGSKIERGEMLELLQNKGEHMTEYELAEYLSVLLGFSPDPTSSEVSELDVGRMGDVIDRNLPQEIDASIFADKILGFSMYTSATEPSVK